MNLQELTQQKIAEWAAMAREMGVEQLVAMLAVGPVEDQMEPLGLDPRGQRRL